MGLLHFAVYKTNDGKYYFSVLNDAFKILCSSDPVPDRESVNHAIETIKLEASDATTLDFL